MRLLVTGGAGLIDSTLIRYVLSGHPGGWQPLNTVDFRAYFRRQYGPR